jgi:hypothetical protein
MEKITLINTGTDVWAPIVTIDGSDVTLSLPAATVFTIYVDSVKVGSSYQTIHSTSQYVRLGEIHPLVTEIEAPLMAAWLILGAIVAVQIFRFINPFHSTGT